MTPQLDCILLVDDSSADNYLHERALRGAGYASTVVAFTRPADALAELRGGEIAPGLVFIDINMPAMTGWEFLDEFDRLPATLSRAPRIVMLTASLNPEDEARAARRETSPGFLTKPLTIEACRQVVHDCLGAP